MRTSPACFFAPFVLAFGCGQLLGTDDYRARDPGSGGATGSNAGGVEGDANPRGGEGGAASGDSGDPGGSGGMGGGSGSDAGAMSGGEGAAAAGAFTGNGGDGGGCKDVPPRAMPAVGWFSAPQGFGSGERVRFSERGTAIVAGVIEAGSSLIFPGTDTLWAGAGGRTAYVAELDPARASAADFAKWAVTIGGSGSYRGGIAVDHGSAGTLVAGAFSGTIGIADRKVTATGSNDVFVALLDDDGAPRWLRSFRGNGREPSGMPVAVALAPDAALVAFASVGGALLVLGGCNAAGVKAGLVLARLDLTSGDCRAVSGVEAAEVSALDAAYDDASDSLTVAGVAVSDVLQSTLVDPDPDSDIFVMRRAASTLLPVWSKSVVLTSGPTDGVHQGISTPPRVALDACGGIFVTGAFGDGQDATELSIFGTTHHAQGADAFVLELDAAGDLKWKLVDSTPGDLVITDAAAADGRLALAGWVRARDMTLAQAPLPGLDGTHRDGFVTLLSTHTPQAWLGARRFGDLTSQRDQRLLGVDLAPGGTLVLTGDYDRSLHIADADGGDLSSQGTSPVIAGAK